MEQDEPLGPQRCSRGLDQAKEPVAFDGSWWSRWLTVLYLYGREHIDSHRYRGHDPCHACDYEGYGRDTLAAGNHSSYGADQRSRSRDDASNGCDLRCKTRRAPKCLSRPQRAQPLAPNAKERSPTTTFELSLRKKQPSERKSSAGGTSKTLSTHSMLWYYLTYLGNSPTARARILRILVTIVGTFWNALGEFLYPSIATELPVGKGLYGHTGGLPGYNRADYYMPALGLSVVAWVDVQVGPLPASRKRDLPRHCANRQRRARTRLT